MCFGYDGEAALRQSLERQGASRRNMLRGAALTAAGVASIGALGATSAEAAGAGRKKPAKGGKEVPEGKISIQLYTLRAAMTDPAGVDLGPREVTVTIDLKSGSERATVWTNDLTHAYVHENSAYSS